MDPRIYLQNPDINLAEEDQDGALLFNPDTDQVQLINDTGLFIWKLCAQGYTSDQIVAAIKVEFDGVPDDQVEADVQAFVEPMLQAGFLGTLVTS